MTKYIIIEKPGISAITALRSSRIMMRGNAVNLFKLDLRLWWYYLAMTVSTVICYGDQLLPALGIGWDILSSLTLGIGNLWLRPYKQAANAAFYREISGTGYAAFDPSYT